MQSLYESILISQEVNTLLDMAPKQDGEKVIVPYTNSTGTIYPIPSTITDKLIEKSYTTSHDSSDNLQHMFNIHTMQFPSPSRILAVVPKLLADTRVYGILGFNKNNEPTNLLHFLTPVEQLNQEFTKLVIYTYKNFSPSEPSTKELENIARIYAAVTSSKYQRRTIQQGATTVRNSTNKTNIWNQLYSSYVEANEAAILPEGETQETAIIPLFFLSRGIVYPNYGVTSFKTTEGYRKATDLTPCISANTSATNNANICTGSLPSNEFNSYRSLNYSNLDSPYRRDVIPDNLPAIVGAHKEFMKEIYKGLNNESN